VDYLLRLQHFHWAFWAALGFVIGLGVLLITMRLWDSWKGNPSGTAYQTALQRLNKKSMWGRRKVYISTSDTLGKHSIGRVMECNVNSISLGSGNCIIAGTILNLRPVDLPAAFGWASVEVKEAKQDGTHWKLVCRFIRTPPWVTRYCDDDAADLEAAKVDV